MIIPLMTGGRLGGAAAGPHQAGREERGVPRHRRHRGRQPQVRA